MDAIQEVKPLCTYLRKCNPYGHTRDSATLMDVLEEVKLL